MSDVISQFNRIFEDAFLKGQKDCTNNVEHKAGMPEAYDRGYATEYDKEQAQSEMSKNVGH